MKKMMGLAFIFAYLVFAAFGVPELGPRYSPWFLLVLSVCFVWCHVVIAKINSLVSLSMVCFVTLLFPLGVLLFLGIPIYKTWSADELSQFGPFWGLEMIFPLIAASITAVLAKRQKSRF